MEERQIKVLIGASNAAEELRRSFVQTGEPHASASGHLRGLRGRMVTTWDEDPVIVCVALDEPTLARHGRGLRSLLADMQGRPGGVRSIGLLTENGMTPGVAAVGCDVYVGSTLEAREAIRRIQAEGTTASTRRMTGRWSSDPPASSGQYEDGPSRFGRHDRRRRM